MFFLLMSTIFFPQVIEDAVSDFCEISSSLHNPHDLVSISRHIGQVASGNWVLVEIAFNIIDLTRTQLDLFVSEVKFLFSGNIKELATLGKHEDISFFGWLIETCFFCLV